MHVPKCYQTPEYELHTVAHRSCLKGNVCCSLVELTGEVIQPLPDLLDNGDSSASVECGAITEPHHHQRLKSCQVAYLY